jgi:biofilm PGA synthesis N-glycosyltransferase PgaC
VNAIGSTIDYLMAQDYAGPIRVILADNNSTDNTVDVARQAAREVGMNLTVVHESLPGKSNALNTALRIVETDLVLTLDADTELHDQALRRLVSRKQSSPGDVVAVAGSILVANEDQSFWSRMQGWDYFLAIASIKRMQGLYSSTLVAQGAFSIYETARLREVGGWPDSIGEDIVVTWRLLDNGGRVTFEPTAVAFTDVPVTLRHLIAQRSRWARGMVEAIHAVKPWSQPRGLTGAITAIDLAIPWLDLGYTFVWIPGLVLACFGIFWIVGLWTLLVFPVTLLIYASLAHFQNRHVVKPLNLDIRHSWFGLVTFLLVFQLVMSPVSIWGYLQEIFGMRRRWR